MDRNGVDADEKRGYRVISSKCKSGREDPMQGMARWRYSVQMIALLQLREAQR